MRKIHLAVIVITIVVVSLAAGCDLFNDTLYFYSLVKGDQQVTQRSLRYRSGGWTIKMSFGQIGEEGFATKEIAQGHINDIDFRMTFNGAVVDPISAKGVEQLGKNKWHVVQAFQIRPSKGVHSLVGTSIFRFNNDDERTNTITLTIR